MANLLRECPFAAFPKWTRLNQFGMRDTRTQQRPPKSSSIRHDHEGRERKCEIIMDDAQAGPEWPLQYTIPDFFKNCVERFALEDDDRFTVFGRCLFGLGSTYWEEVLVEVPGRSNADLDEAITLYVEKVAQVQYLQDSILRWVSKWKKPFVLDLKEFKRRCDEMYNYAEGPYTRGNVAIPSDRMKKETFFFAMCKPHQEEFATLHEDTEDVTQKQMITYFEGCFRKDANSGRTAQLQTAHEEKCRKANSKRRNGGQASQHGRGQGRGNQSGRRNDGRRNDDRRQDGRRNDGSRNDGRRNDGRRDDSRRSDNRRDDKRRDDRSSRSYRRDDQQGRSNNQGRGRRDDRDNNRSSRRSYDAHNVEDADADSRSASRSRSPVRSRSRSHSKDSHRSRNSQGSDRSEMSSHHIGAYHMEEALPAMMSEKERIPKKKTTGTGKSSRVVAKKDRKSPPEPVARKSNVEIYLGSDSDDERFGDKELERAQNGSFGRKRPDFKNLKSEATNLKPLDKEKEDGEIQPAHEKDAGVYSIQEYKDWTEANKGEFLKVKSHVHYRAYAQESVRKPILRDPNGKAIGTGSFWLRQPFDYSDRERDLPQKEFDRVRTQDLTFADRQRRCALDDVSIDSGRPGHENPSDWQIRTGVKMTTRDITFDDIDHNKKLDMATDSQGQKFLHYTPWQRCNLAICLKAQKERAAKVLKQNQKGLAEAKKRARSRSQSSEPTVTKNKGKARKSRK